MPTTSSVTLSAEVVAEYDADFLMQCQGVLYWDQFCDLREQMNGERGKTYNFPLVASLQPSTAPLNELLDVTPQPMSAMEIAITLQEFGGAIELTKFVVATSYSDVLRQAAYVNGFNLAESVDFVVRAVAGQGSRQFMQNNRTARNLFNGRAVDADRLKANFLELLGVFGKGLKMPFFEDGALVTCIHFFPFYDLLQDVGIRGMAQYQHPEILFNGEMAYWGGIRLCVSANAKGFWGAGAAQSFNSLVTTLAAPAAAGDTNIKVASVTTVSVGDWIAINDGSETGNTWYDTNELARVTAVGTLGAGGTGLTIFALDPGPNGDGLRFSHASGVVVNNSNSVYPMPLLGPNSITKICSDWTGPYGQTVISGPYDTLQRFIRFGWYLLAGYGRTLQGWLLRGEFGSSIS